MRRYGWIALFTGLASLIPLSCSPDTRSVSEVEPPAVPETGMYRGQQPVELTDPADIALSEIMREHQPAPSEGKYIVRADWAADLEAFLKRGDITPEQRVYAKYKLAYLHTGVTPGKEGWEGDKKRGIQLYKDVMDSLPGVFCWEKRLATSVYGTLYAGSREDQIERMAEAYEYLLTFTEEDIAKSADVIDRDGYCIDKALYLRHIKLPPMDREEKANRIRRSLRAGIEHMENKAIPGYLERTKDPVAAAHLLELVKDIAPPEKYAEWKTIRGKDYTTTQTRNAALPPGIVYPWPEFAEPEEHIYCWRIERNAPYKLDLVAYVLEDGGVTYQVRFGMSRRANQDLYEHLFRFEFPVGTPEQVRINNPEKYERIRDRIPEQGGLVVWGEAQQPGSPITRGGRNRNFNAQPDATFHSKGLDQRVSLSTETYRPECVGWFEDAEGKVLKTIVCGVRLAPDEEEKTDLKLVLDGHRRDPILDVPLARVAKE